VTIQDAESAEADVWAEDPNDTDVLYSELRGVAGITVTAASAPAEPGEQGSAVDLLMVGLSSGAVTAFLQIIRAIAVSKGPKFVLNIRRGKNQLKITADNLDEVEPLIRKLFGGR